jgi:hypothetical protein
MMMNKLARLLAVAACAAAVTAPSAAASASSPCSLLTGSQVQSVHVSNTTCTAKPAKSSTIGTVYTANWGAKTILDPHVSVTILKPSNPLVLEFEKKSAAGQPVKVGSWARGELVNGKTGGNLGFISHGYYVGLVVHTPTKKPLSSMSQVVALANAIIQKL